MAFRNFVKTGSNLKNRLTTTNESQIRTVAPSSSLKTVMRPLVQKKSNQLLNKQQMNESTPSNYNLNRSPLEISFQSNASSLLEMKNDRSDPSPTKNGPIRLDPISMLINFGIASWGLWSFLDDDGG